MRYIRVYGEAAYCGTSFEEYLETDMTDEQLDDYVSDKVAENAESYDYMVFGWDTSMEEYAEENGITMELAEQMMEDYYADASGFWEEVSEEEYNENVQRL